MKFMDKLKYFAFAAMSAVSTSAMAEAMPWEGPICKIATSFSGPVATAFVVLAIVICGALLAFGELNGIFKTLLGVAIGGAMAVGAVQWTKMFTGATAFCSGMASADSGMMFAKASEAVAQWAPMLT